MKNSNISFVDLWNTPMPGFCESIVSGPPEYLNSVSSVFMLLYGIAGLFASRNHNMAIRIASGSLAATGVGSILYHYTLYSGWGQLDGLPMLVASYIGAYIAIDSVIYKMFYIDRNERRKYEIISGVLSLFISFGLSISLSISAIKETEHLFTILFLIPEVMIAIGVIFIRVVTHRRISADATTPLIALRIYNGFDFAFRVMYIGIGTSVGAAIIWAVTENLCPIYPWLRFVPTHAIWHVAISFGMYFLMQFLVFIYSFNKGKSPYWIHGENTAEKIFFRLVPAVGLHQRLSAAN